MTPGSARSEFIGFSIRLSACIVVNFNQALAITCEQKGTTQQLFEDLHRAGSIAMATTSGEAMQSLEAHMEDMRNLTLCKICLRPFYEPFILGCGHSFCYSCLRSWFGGANERRKNKNCPDCRTEVKAEPAPNYLLREISHLFLSRAELLPEDETVAEHKKDQDEEAKLLSKDKKEEGLFQGVFKEAHLRPFMAPIQDFEDRVERCPVCTYEIEDGRCFRCGLTFGATDFSEDESDLSGLSDMDDDSELDSDEDESEADEALPYPHFHAIDIEEEDEEDEDDSDINEYDRRDDFIDNEEEVDMDFMGAIGDYENSPTDAPTPYSEEELSDSDVQFGYRVGRPLRRVSRVVHDSDEESISTDPEPHPPARADRRTIVIDDDEEDEESQSSQAPPQFSSEPEVESRPFMMPDLDEENSNSDDSENESSSDDGGSSSDSESQSSDHDHDSDSNSDSSNATIEDNAADEDNHAEEDSDDTVIPPQAKRIRQSRLQEHRDRRSFSGSTNSNLSRGRLRISRADGPTRSNRRGRLTSVH